MIGHTLFFKRPGLTAGSLFSLTILMVTPCHADKDAGHATFKVSAEMGKLLYEDCTSCHDDSEQEGDIRLNQLDKLKLDNRLDLLNKMQEKIRFKEMPPRKEKEQPTYAERTAMLKWLSGELKKHNASKLEDKLRMPEYGNYVEHDKLFSGDYQQLKAFTPDRRWLINPLSPLSDPLNGDLKLLTSKANS